MGWRRWGPGLKAQHLCTWAAVLVQVWGKCMIIGTRTRQGKIFGSVMLCVLYPYTAEL